AAEAGRVARMDRPAARRQRPASARLLWQPGHVGGGGAVRRAVGGAAASLLASQNAPGAPGARASHPEPYPPGGPSHLDRILRVVPTALRVAAPADVLDIRRDGDRDPAAHRPVLSAGGRVARIGARLEDTWVAGAERSEAPAALPLYLPSPTASPRS